MNARIKELQAQIEAEEHRIKYCEHVFDKPFSNPEETVVPVGYDLEVHGSDVWPVSTGFKTISKPRWTRICTKCGGIQHTYTQRTIEVKQEPNFN